jgi:hypothetical protein
MNLINRKQAARELGISHRTLEKWAVTGEGPTMHKLGARVLYDTDKLEAWANMRTVRSTSELIGGQHNG